MTDQPKPSQPPALPNAADAKQPSPAAAPAADKAPVTQAKPADADSKPASSSGATRIIEPPKPLGDAKPVAPAPTPASAPTQSTASKPADAPAAPVTSTPTEKSDASPAEKPSIASSATVPLPPPPAAAGLPTTSVLPPLPEKDDTILPQSNGGNKVTQRFSDLSPAAAAAAAGTICPSCGHRNRPGTLICDNCGTNLVAGAKSSVGTRDLVSAAEAATAAGANEPLLDSAQIKAIESAGGSVFTDDMVLRIEIEGGATPMLVYPKQEIILGRRDPNTGTLPDVDMTAYSGYRMGVSRTHASIRLQDKQLNLSDRGSSNGTFLNGTRLVAHRPYPVKDGDEIRLGQMVLKVYFQSNKGRK